MVVTLAKVKAEMVGAVRAEVARVTVARGRQEGGGDGGKHESGVAGDKGGGVAWAGQLTASL